MQKTKQKNDDDNEDLQGCTGKSSGHDRSRGGRGSCAQDDVPGLGIEVDEGHLDGIDIDDLDFRDAHHGLVAEAGRPLGDAAELQDLLERADPVTAASSAAAAAVAAGSHWIVPVFAALRAALRPRAAAYRHAG